MWMDGGEAKLQVAGTILVNVLLQLLLIFLAHLSHGFKVNFCDLMSVVIRLLFVSQQFALINIS